MAERRVSDDVATINPASPRVEPSAVCHLIAEAREVVVLKKTIVTCRGTAAVIMRSKFIGSFDYPLQFQT